MLFEDIILFIYYYNILKRRLINIAIKIKKRYQGRQRDTHRDFINEGIRAKELLVIDQNGEKLGIISRAEALRKADEAELDLILISDKGEITVAKIADYGKFKYERKKKESETKKNQKIIETKEVRLRPNIGQHDLDVKIKAARKFIEKGNRVKVSLSYRGREMANKEVGLQTINNFLDQFEDIAQIDKRPKLTGRFLDAYISPIKN
uniref:Translation initiation factor IF-3 n=1 Tax=Hirondellea gigas TaxID=1518452 RepID=A0A6A7G646_9CRUS